MKNVFFIISAILLLTSCGNEPDDEQNRANPVYGVWDSYHQNTDSLVLTRVFTADFYSYFSFAEGKSQQELNKQEYAVIGNQLILNKYTQTFSLEQDTLWITNSNADQITKYIRRKNHLQTP